MSAIGRTDQGHLSSGAKAKTAKAPVPVPSTWRVQIYRVRNDGVLTLANRPLILAGKDPHDVQDIALMGRDPRVWRAVCTPLGHIDR